MEFVEKQSTERWLADRARLAGASNAVFCNGDLVALILTNNVGPATFSAASQINSTAHTVCRTSMPLLKSVAFHSSALTTTQFRGLFALKAADAAALPHEDRVRYRLYRKPAIDAVFGRPDVMACIARALPAHGETILHYRARNAVYSSPSRHNNASSSAYRTYHTYHTPTRSRYGSSHDLACGQVR